MADIPTRSYRQGLQAPLRQHGAEEGRLEHFGRISKVYSWGMTRVNAGRNVPTMTTVRFYLENLPIYCLPVMDVVRLICNGEEERQQRHSGASS
jgi:hypothetical protein